MDIKRRSTASPQECEMQPLPAVTGRNKTVAIDETLHARLKVIAAQEGKMLQALVESKLLELISAEAVA
jgi:predicted HicB family RNase H-like nuclease